MSVIQGSYWEREREEKWLTEVIQTCPPGTSLKIFIESSGSTQVLITRNMKLGSTQSNPDGVWLAKKTITLNVKESSNLTQWVLEPSVGAQVVNAAWDMPLSITTAWDTAVEEWCKWTDLRDEVIATHQSIRCPGLRGIGPCNLCQQQFGDSHYGERITHKLSILEAIWNTGEVEPDDGFDPTSIQVSVSDTGYDPEADNFLQMAERYADKLVR